VAGRTNDVKQEARRTKVAQLMATMRRPSARRIVAALAKLRDPIKTTKSTVHRDMVAIRSEWREARAKELDVVVGAELEKLAVEEEQCYAALQASTQPLVEQKTVTTRHPVRVGNDGEVQYHERTVVHHMERQRNADPRYFRALVEIKRRRAEMLGLDAPKGVDLTSGGEAIPIECAPGFGDWQPPEHTAKQQAQIDDLREEIEQLRKD
jgi:hypothetical protein